MRHTSPTRTPGFAYTREELQVSHLLSGWRKASALAGVARRGGLQGTLKNQWCHAQAGVGSGGSAAGWSAAGKRRKLQQKFPENSAILPDS